MEKRNYLPLQKAGSKFKIDRKSFYHLIYSFQTKEAKTLKEVSNYVYKKTGLQLSIPTIYRILRKIKYSHHGIHYRNPKQKQNLAEALEFMEEVSKLSQHLILAADESGYPLNLAPKKRLRFKRLSAHKTKKVREVLDKNNMKPRFIVSANPWLNPTELVFNVKKYVRNQEPKIYEELRKVVDDKIKVLQGEDLRQYFKDCLDFDFILKNGH
ncbi:hypothetical protein C1645_738252 [Glomus cerebriforme]|uniref:Tc1-like transposase DDE domain-containing protein n=1 Tax=Glomus cerebriforme TaxID=658196 RepID=A0A397T4B5_9GLOM|nr:hypothetical protein C1645_738252 [Glomus cerebriforme]